MCQLKSVGFFRELQYGYPEAPSLKKSCGKLAIQHQEKIINYLKNGTKMMEMPMVNHDILADNNPPIGSLIIFTDGKWSWPSDLAYYVEHYAVELPKSFLKWMAEREWKQTKLKDKDLAGLSL